MAEELAQDALVAALERWPGDGVPENPGAWLMATAKHRAIDVLRRGQRQERTHAELEQDLEAEQAHGGPDLTVERELFPLVVGQSTRLQLTGLIGGPATFSADARINPLGAILEFQVPTPNSQPFSVPVGGGPNGKIWFTERSGRKIGTMTFP